MPLAPDTEEAMSGLADDIMQDDFSGQDESITDIESEAARLASASRKASAGFAVTKANRSRAIRGWTALAACLVLLVGGGYALRVSVVKMFPASAQLYAMAGLDVNVRGLEFRNLSLVQDFERGVPVMSIKGEIVNISGETVVLPRVRLSLIDEAEQEIYHWTLKADTRPLPPDAKRTFSTRLASPPAAARNIQVRFASIAR